MRAEAREGRDRPQERSRQDEDAFPTLSPTRNGVRKPLAPGSLSLSARTDPEGPGWGFRPTSKGFTRLGSFWNPVTGDLPFPFSLEIFIYRKAERDGAGSSFVKAGHSQRTGVRARQEAGTVRQPPPSPSGRDSPLPTPDITEARLSVFPG